jgi:cystinosin
MAVRPSSDGAYRSVSFYPQVISNHRHRLSGLPGLSSAFLLYNLTGFAFYLVFTLATYAPSGSVALNDIAFAAHALLLTTITLGQYIRSHHRTKRTPSRPHLLLLALLWLAPGALALAAALGRIPPRALVAYFGAAKVFITTVKYVPQVVLNRRRGNTTHWAIGNVLLDATGGILSLAQQGVDAHRLGREGRAGT